MALSQLAPLPLAPLPLAPLPLAPSQYRSESSNCDRDYILVVGHVSDRNRHQRTESYKERLQCPVVVADSLAQAIASAQHAHPYLVILSGQSIQQWSPQIAKQLRQSVQPFGLVIVAVTDSSELSWASEPRDTGLDGFFVEPISATVLSALNESAIAKHKYLQYA